MRGYLKHKVKEVGKKAARGGSSRNHPRHSSPWEKDLPNRKHRKALEYDDHVDWYNADYVWLSEEEEEEEEEQMDEKFVKEYEELDHRGKVKNDSVSHTGNALPTNTNEIDQESLTILSASDFNSYSFCNEEDESSVITGFSFVEGVDVQSISTETTNEKHVIVCLDERVKADCGESTSSFVDVVAATETDPASCVTMVASKVSKIQHAVLATCAICLDEKQLIRVMNNCSHPQACYDCLRMQYIFQAQQSSENYPLQCFWPGCNRTLRDVQIRRFVKSQRELGLHYALEGRAKRLRLAEKRRNEEAGMRLKLNQRRANRLETPFTCTHCHAVNVIRPFVSRESKCFQCSCTLEMDKMLEKEILSVLEAVGENLVNCPSCSTIIVKDGGCDHMTCVCGAQFSFADARRKLDI